MYKTQRFERIIVDEAHTMVKIERASFEMHVLNNFVPVILLVEREYLISQSF